MPAYAFDRVLTPDGWLAPGRIEIGDDGRIAGVEAGDKGERIGGIALPGMPNLHSHAFQRAMAGLTERAGPGADSFWTWREVMYGFVDRLGPDDAEAVAAQLYCEMLKAGYTAVAEFHYLHHAPDGGPYDDLAEMAERVTRAARRTGIALTLLPVLYNAGGFGGAPVGGAQRRFANDAERLLRIVETMRLPPRRGPRISAWVSPRTACGRSGPGAWWRRSRGSIRWTGTRRSISISPNRPGKWRTASPGRANVPWTGCSGSTRWDGAGASSTPPT